MEGEIYDRCNLCGKLQAGKLATYCLCGKAHFTCVQERRLKNIAVEAYAPVPIVNPLWACPYCAKEYVTNSRPKLGDIDALKRIARERASERMRFSTSTIFVIASLFTLALYISMKISMAKDGPFAPIERPIFEFSLLAAAFGFSFMGMYIIEYILTRPNLCMSYWEDIVAVRTFIRDQYPVIPM